MADEVKVDDSVLSDDGDGYASSSISDTVGTLEQSSGWMCGATNKSKRLLKECMDLRKAKARYEVAKDGNSVTFYPSESAGGTASKKALQTEEFLNSKRFKEIMKFLQCSKVEHMYSDSIKIVKSESYINPFAAAAEFAFYKQFILYLSLIFDILFIVRCFTF